MRDSFYKVYGKDGRAVLRRMVCVGQGTPIGSTRTHFVLAPHTESGEYNPHDVKIVPVGGIGCPEGWHQSPHLAISAAAKEEEAFLNEVKDEIAERVKHHEGMVESIKSLRESVETRA